MLVVQLQACEMNSVYNSIWENNNVTDEEWEHWLSSLSLAKPPDVNKVPSDWIQPHFSSLQK